MTCNLQINFIDNLRNVYEKTVSHPEAFPNFSTYLKLSQFSLSELNAADIMKAIEILQSTGCRQKGNWLFGKCDQLLTLCDVRFFCFLFWLTQERMDRSSWSTKNFWSKLMGLFSIWSCANTSTPNSTASKITIISQALAITMISLRLAYNRLRLFVIFTNWPPTKWFNTIFRR